MRHHYGVKLGSVTVMITILLYFTKLLASGMAALGRRASIQGILHHDEMTASGLDAHLRNVVALEPKEDMCHIISWVVVC